MQILDHLSQNRDVQIGEEGELIYQQQRLHGSHITNLISDYLQKKSQTDHPTGWKEFSDSLKVVNISHKLVLNEDRLNYILYILR